MRDRGIRATSLLWALGLVAPAGMAGAQTQGKTATEDKIPITTSSGEARQLFLKGRDLSEKLRATDARRHFEEAAAKDKAFALAQLGLANTAGTAKEFFDALGKAVALAPQASEAERHMILGLEAGVKGDLTAQRNHYLKLTQAFPKDERGYNLLGGYHFGRQEYAAAVEQLQKAIEISPGFSSPYNLLGYSYRFLEKYPEAEKAFKRYTELIPDDPNPYDSYAELLMKMGRFEDSIKNYEKALSLDPNFVASYVGIGHDQIFLGRPEEARKAFARIGAVARNTGEKRQAHLWTAASYVHEVATDKALAEVQKMRALAEAEGDLASVSGDLNLAGTILLEAGDPEKAGASFAQTVEVMNKAGVPEEIKEATRRNQLYNEARVALARKDLATARSKADAYARQVAAKAIPFEVRQQHELAGRIALEGRDYPGAVTELEVANQQDPRVLYLLAVALQGRGDQQRAREICAKAANFNGLGINYAYVRARAQQMLARS